jgi:hypothetical protein
MKFERADIIVALFVSAFRSDVGFLIIVNANYLVSNVILNSTLVIFRELAAPV